MTKFKNLDTLRALAALIVLGAHMEGDKRMLGYTDYIFRWPDPHMSVVLFFVLSGFLLTYLLTYEYTTTKDISFRKFYIKRILRILPLYYMILFLASFLNTEDPTVTSIILNLAVFPNVARTIGQPWENSPQIWSIGVEQQFYLFIPILLLLLHRKGWYLKFSLLFILFWTILPHAIMFVNVRSFHLEMQPVINFFHDTKFNALAMGSVCGYMYATNHKWLKFVQNKYLFYIILSLAVISWGGHIQYSFFTDEVMAAYFAIVILNFATNPDIKISIDCKPLNYLGKISYGIYMYHWIVFTMALRLLPPMYDNQLLYNIILYSTVIGVTIGVSALSYHTYEKFFMSLRKKII